MQFVAHQAELASFMALRTTTKGTPQCSKKQEHMND